MIERLEDPNAANWVDRGEPPEPTMQRVLEFYLGRDVVMEPARLREHVVALRGMAEADSTEYQLAGYLALIEKEAGLTTPDTGVRRTTAIALWHIAKSAAVRDRAKRLITVGFRPGAPPQSSDATT